jgi:serine phosphatase RsbU (regulator of sigma subunit)
MLYRAGARGMTLGGDFLDTWTDQGDRMAFVLGDVCGHGPEQAALGVMLRSAWTGMVSAGERDPATLAERLQDVIELRRTQDSMFTTLVTGFLDPDGRVVDLVCAGHPPPMAVSTSARYLEAQPQLPIGVVSGNRYRTDRLRLEPDEGLLVFSDGLFESKQPVVGLDGLRDLVAELRPRADADLARLVSSVEERQGAVDDDVAVLLIDR